MSSAAVVVVRFYFIRHGETLANCAGLVVGQSDSPLTFQGKQQARQLYQYPHRWCSCDDDNHDIVENDGPASTMNWWRIYVSDLKRTQHTACLVLGLLNEDDDEVDDDEVIDQQQRRQAYIPSTATCVESDSQWQTYQTLLQRRGVRLDVRIRETAKGVCEGLPKKTSYEQALQLWKSKHSNNSTTEPLKESPDQGWNRVMHWMMDVVGDAVREQHHTAPPPPASATTTTTSDDDYNNKEDDHSEHVIILPVLAVMHAGILRNTLTRMFAAHDHDHDDHDPTIQQACASSKDGLLEIPNMSVTVVDLHVRDTQDDVWIHQNHNTSEKMTTTTTNDAASDSTLSWLSPPLLNPNDLWTAKLVHLTWTGHLQGTGSGEAGNAE